MAQATAEQIAQLEFAHKQQLRDLLVAWQVFQAFQAAHPEPNQSKAKFGTSLVTLTNNWMLRNMDYELQGGTPLSIFSKRGTLPLFVDPVRFKSTILPNAAYYIFKQKSSVTNPQSIGFIPLLIWAVIALIAYFTVSKVVDGQTATADDRVKLIDSTNKFCADNNLTPAQCTAMLTQQTDAANNSPGFFDSINSMLLWGGAE